MDRPLVALDMIVRNDSRSLQRALESARPHVDEILIGIDERTEDAETRKVAEKYADVVWSFGADDVGLSAAQWKANMIHFSNARNIGRAKVRAPWTLFLDSDEYMGCDLDLRAVLLRYLFTDVRAFAPIVGLGSFSFRDAQRLARTYLRWESPTHNQLPGAGIKSLEAGFEVIQDTSLRTEADRHRRAQQRDEGINLLRPLAAEGDINALFHLAKHEVYKGDLAAGVKYATDYRTVSLRHGPFADHRGALAVAVAYKYQIQKDPVQAEVWALRALQDGPHIQAFEVLAELATERGQAEHASVWMAMAKVTPVRQNMRIPTGSPKQ